MFRWAAPYPGLASGVGSNLASEQGCKAVWNDGSGSTLGQASKLETDTVNTRCRKKNPEKVPFYNVVDFDSSWEHSYTGVNQ